MSKKALIASKIKDYTKRLAELNEGVADKRFSNAIRLEEQGKSDASLDEYMKSVESYFDSMNLHDSQGDHHAQLRVSALLLVVRKSCIYRLTFYVSPSISHAETSGRHTRSRGKGQEGWW